MVSARLLSVMEVMKERLANDRLGIVIEGMDRVALESFLSSSDQECRRAEDVVAFRRRWYGLRQGVRSVYISILGVNGDRR